MARSRRADWHRKGPLLGVNRTKSPRARIDEIDHTRHNVCSGSWSRENAVAWRSEWIIFSIANFAANIVMRDGFRSIWEKQFQSFPSLRGFHTARVKLPRRGASKRLLRRSFFTLANSTYVKRSAEKSKNVAHAASFCKQPGRSFVRVAHKRTIDAAWRARGIEVQF